MRKLLAVLALLPSLLGAQQLRTMTRTTSTTGLNDSALTFISDSGSRTRAASIAQLRKSLSIKAFDSLKATGVGTFGTNPGQTGILRIPSGTTNGLVARNNANSGDLSLIFSDASDNVKLYGGTLSITGAGVSTFSGSVTANDVFTLAGSAFRFVGRAMLASPADGIITLFNNAQTDFTRLQFGGGTSSFPSLRRNSGQLEVRTADDAAYAPFQASRHIGLADITNATAYGTFSDGGYSSGTDANITSVKALVASTSSAAASGTTINEKTQMLQTAATSGAVYASHNTSQVTHTSGTVANMFGVDGVVYFTGSGGTTTRASALFGQNQVQAGAVVTTLNGLEINNFSISGTVTTAIGASIGTVTGATNNYSIKTSSGFVSLGDSTGVAGYIKSTSPSGGVGYATGAGGTVAQGTSKATGVTLNTITGQITTNSASLNANTIVAFTVSNTSISDKDVVIVTLKSGGSVQSYNIWPEIIVNATSFNIAIKNITAGALAENLVINYVIIKGATS